MEELIALALEFLLQLFGELLFGLSLQCFGPRGPQSKTERWTLAIVLSLIGGGSVGLVSLLVFPRAFLHESSLRIANLVASPIAVGATMAALGRYRRSERRGPFRIDSFWIAFSFALAMTAVRFAAARR